MVLLKVSLSIWFYRLMQHTWQRVVLIFLVVLTVALGTAYFFFELFQCGNPMSSTPWFFKKVDDSCIPNAPALGVGYSHAVINAVTDVIICALPLPTIWRAKLNTKERVMISGIILLASSSSIASIVRLAYTRGIIDNTSEFLIKLQPLAIVASVELGLGITAASLITLRPLLSRFAHLIGARKKKKQELTSDRTFEDADQLMAMNSAFTPGTTLVPKSEKNNINFLISQTIPSHLNRGRKSANSSKNYVLPAINPTTPLPPLFQESATSRASSPELPIQSDPQPQILYAPRPTRRINMFSLPRSSHSTAPPSQQSRLGFLNSQQPTTPQPSASIHDEHQLHAGGWWRSGPRGATPDRLQPPQSSIGALSSLEATQGSSQDTAIESYNSSDHVERSTLEQGYRRWVIERPSPHGSLGRISRAFPKNNGRY
jgi:hypothetical protein